MSVFNATCTGCGVELEIPSEYAGQTIACPQCSTQFVATAKQPAQQQQAAQQQKQQSSLDMLGKSTAGSKGKRKSKPASQNPYGVGGGGAKSSRSGLPAKRTYPALVTVRSVYAVLAYVVLVLGAIFLLMQGFLLVRGGIDVVSFAGVFVVTTIVSVFNFITLKAFSEGLKLMMDIQDNTLVSARNSER